MPWDKQGEGRLERWIPLISILVNVLRLIVELLDGSNRW